MSLKIDISRVAFYFSGRMTPYYTDVKIDELELIEFIKKNSPNSYSDDFFKLIGKESFYKNLLNVLKRKDEKVLFQLIQKHNVPMEIIDILGENILKYKKPDFIKIGNRLSGTFAPYYGGKKIIEFIKLIKELDPIEYTNENIEFFQRITTLNDFFYGICDDIYDRKKDLLIDGLLKIGMPEELIERNDLFIEFEKNDIDSDIDVVENKFKNASLWLSGEEINSTHIPMKEFIDILDKRLNLFRFYSSSTNNFIIDNELNELKEKYKNKTGTSLDYGIFLTEISKIRAIDSIIEYFELFEYFPNYSFKELRTEKKYDNKKLSSIFSGEILSQRRVPINEFISSISKYFFISEERVERIRLVSNNSLKQFYYDIFCYIENKKYGKDYIDTIVKEFNISEEILSGTGYKQYLTNSNDYSDYNISDLSKLANLITGTHKSCSHKFTEKELINFFIKSGISIDKINGFKSNYNRVSEWIISFLDNISKEDDSYHIFKNIIKEVTFYNPASKIELSSIVERIMGKKEIEKEIDVRRLAQFFAGTMPFYGGNLNRFHFIKVCLDNNILDEKTINDIKKDSVDDEDFFFISLCEIKFTKKIKTFLLNIEPILKDIPKELPEEFKFKRVVENKFNLDIRKIAMFLAGKLPPYYGESNLRSFTKKIRTFVPKVFTDDEILFIQQQAKNIEEEFYFMILDDLYKDNKEGDKLNKFINLLIELGIPSEVLGIERNNSINKISLEKLSKYFSGKLPNSEKINIPDFINILKNLNIENQSFSKYSLKCGSMKKDYENLFSEILNSEDGEEIINKILNYFDLPRSFIEKSEYNIENEEKKINEFRELYLSKNGKRISRRKIASYLAGTFPGYFQAPVSKGSFTNLLIKVTGNRDYNEICKNIVGFSKNDEEFYFQCIEDLSDSILINLINEKIGRNTSLIDELQERKRDIDILIEFVENNTEIDGKKIKDNSIRNEIISDFFKEKHNNKLNNFLGQFIFFIKNYKKKNILIKNIGLEEKECYNTNVKNILNNNPYKNMDNKSTLLDEIRTEKISKLKDSIKKIMSELDSKNDTIKKEILELEEKLKGLKKEYQENSYLMENWNENFAENNVEYIEDVIAKYSNGIENAEIQK